jgi:uncharacterized protein YeaO (DUF488 family)
MIDEWAKEISPSPDLRKWYNHQPERWKEFAKLYKNELRKSKEVEDFIASHQDSKTITLVFAAKDPAFSHALVLQKFLKDHFSK